MIMMILVVVVATAFVVGVLLGTERQKAHAEIRRQRRREARRRTNRWLGLPDP